MPLLWLCYPLHTALLTEPGLSGCTSVMQKLMIEMSIRVTPTFCIFHHKEVIRTVTGISEDNLKAAIAEELDNVKAGPSCRGKPVEGCSAAQWTACSHRVFWLVSDLAKGEALTIDTITPAE